jgi:hypothetical protein
MMKRIALAVLLALTAVSGATLAHADTDDGGGIVGTQAP